MSSSPIFSSPFLAVPQASWLCANELAFAIFDGFPVSPGHVLVTTRRRAALQLPFLGSERELALFDLLLKDNISTADRERLKQASKTLLAALRERIASMPNWTKTTTTQADVKILILDSLFQSLPRPPFTDEEAESLADRLYGFVWQQSDAGALFTDAA